MNPTESTKPDKRGSRKTDVSDWLGYGVLAFAVWLGWEAIKQPIVARTPPEIALRLAPTSPEVMRRAAEVELAAGRVDNARALADESLVRAPFNARALRVDGLAAAREGRTAAADQMLTVAGNWSLRDDPAHAWLIEHRLRVGDYGSAFAHADTLLRRRTDIAPQVFKLYTVAAMSDPRALPAVIRVMERNPPWRNAYLTYLHETADGDPMLLALALGLEKSKVPLNEIELGRLYQVWAQEGRIGAINLVRSRTNRPPVSTLLQDGDFTAASGEQPSPFAWRPGVGAGFDVQVTQDDLRKNNMALRADYNGYHSGYIVEQLVLLGPGTYALSGDERFEVRPDTAKTRWTLTCLESGVPLSAQASSQPGGAEAWSRFSVRWQVPPENCSAQWLRLDTIPDERRTTVVVWYDQLALRPVA